MRAFAWLIVLFRAAIRLLMTERTSVGAVEKFARGVLLVPVFGVMFVLVLLRALVLGPMRIEAQSADGDWYACHLPDLIQTYIYLFGAWEPDIAVFMRSRLQAGDVFVDVGANIGYDTMLAARPVGDAGRVVAIEAAPAVFDRLLETLRLNGSPTNVRTISKAVSASRGVLAVYAGPQHNIGLTTTVRRGNMPRIAEVEAMPLGDLLLPDELGGACE